MTGAPFLAIVMIALFTTAAVIIVRGNRETPEMTMEKLKQAAIEYLAQAFKSAETPPVHLVQAAVAIVLAPVEQSYPYPRPPAQSPPASVWP